MLRASRINYTNTIRPSSDIDGLGFIQIEEQWPRIVEQSEQSPGLAIRDQVKVGHTAPDQRMSFDGGVTDVQPRQVRCHVSANLVDLEHFQNRLSKGLRALICSL
jgi:hypothetical protein